MSQIAVSTKLSAFAASGNKATFDELLHVVAGTTSNKKGEIAPSLVQPSSKKVRSATATTTTYTSNRIATLFAAELKSLKDDQETAALMPYLKDLVAADDFFKQ